MLDIYIFDKVVMIVVLMEFGNLFREMVWGGVFMGYMLFFLQEEVEVYWCGVVEVVDCGDIVLFVIEDLGCIVGFV